MDFSKLLVIGIVVSNVIFTVAVLLIYLKMGSEPSTLIAAWFAFTTGELGLLAWIKKNKINNRRRLKIKKKEE